MENVCTMSAFPSVDEPREPFLIILLPRHPRRARAALVIFSFFLSFFIYSQRATVWCMRGTEGVDWTASEVSVWSGDPEKARRKERGKRGRVKERGEEDGKMGGIAREEEEYF